MENNTTLEMEIIKLLEKHGALPLSFITRFLNESGVCCTRQKVERTLRRLIDKKVVEFFYVNNNHRRHYRLR
ncbi:hypothetical protein [Thermococcus sp.]